jgi:DNA-binding NarL/FixJ family response regulator
MDIQMPLLDGVEATRAILEVSPQIRIIILTMYRQDRYVYQAVKAGAWGYLLKDATASEVVEAIRAVARGEALLDATLADAIIDEFGLEAETPANTSATELSEREIALLRLLASGSTNQEIALALGISEKTVRNRLSDIFHKLHLANRTQAAIYAIREGLSELD